MIDTSYRVAGPGIVSEAFDGELVVLNLGTGQYFGFNPSAAAAWVALMAGAKPSQIVAAGAAEPALLALVARLEALNLIVPDPAAPSAALSEAMRAGIAADASAPTVESYDDLADLFLADPIHDVDQEAGWPHLPKAG